jgi:hypothetical protein
LQFRLLRQTSLRKGHFVVCDAFLKDVDSVTQGFIVVEVFVSVVFVLDVLKSPEWLAARDASEVDHVAQHIGDYRVSKMVNEGLVRTGSAINLALTLKGMSEQTYPSPK